MPVEQLRSRSPGYALTLLWLAYTSSLIDRYLFGILGESIKRELALSDAMLGFLAGTAFALLYATLGIPVGWLADRGNRRDIVAAAIALWSAFTVWCGLAGSVLQLAVARMGVGVGEAGAGPPSQALIADLFPAELRGRAMAFFSSAVNLGMLLAFALGGWIGAHYGWRHAFVALGAPGLLIAALVWLTLAEPPRSGDAVRAPLLASLRDVARYIASERALVHVMAGAALAVMMSSALILWLPVFALRVHAVPQQTLGAQFGLMLGVIGAGGVLAIGFLFDRLGARPARKPLLVAGVQLGVCGAVEWALLAPSYAAMLAPLALVALLMNGFLGPTFALTQDIVSDRYRALVPAVSVFLANLVGLGLGPYLFGAASDLAEQSFPGRGLQLALSGGFLLYIASAAHYWRASVWLGRSRLGRAAA